MSLSDINRSKLRHFLTTLILKQCNVATPPIKKDVAFFVHYHYFENVFIPGRPYWRMSLPLDFDINCDGTQSIQRKSELTWPIIKLENHSSSFLQDRLLYNALLSASIRITVLFTVRYFTDNFACKVHKIEKLYSKCIKFLSSARN